VSKKPRTDLVALGSAAVLAVYAAGFVRTRSAAQLFAQETDDRRHPGAPPSATDAAAPVVVTRPTTGTTTVKVAPPVTGAKALAKDSVPAAAADPVAVPVAAAPVAPPAPEPTPVATADTAVAERHVVWRDGVFTGWGTSRHGNIQASVEIKDGRIIAATITQCLTRYSCSWISALPPQVVARQSPEVDYVSGATQSTNAFYWAVVEALKQAK
jgi:uncharacterized protein with FMN-binding domain